MTSPDDFHLISWKNFLGLSAVVVGVLIPVGLRFVLNRRVGAIRLEDDLEEEEGRYFDGEDQILAQGPATGANKGKTTSPQLILLSDSEDEEDALEGGMEEDEILESGPAIVLKDDNDAAKTEPPPQNNPGWRSI